MATITFYRVVSEQEKKDFNIDGLFRTATNTLEAKQFFRSIEAINEFVDNARLQKYHPPYKYLLTIKLDKEHFNDISRVEMMLDGFDAVSIHEDYLSAFNNCVIFVESERL